MEIKDRMDTQEIVMQAARECVLFRIRQIDRKLTQSFDRDMKRAGLRATQFAILCAASLAGPMSQHDFSEMMKVDQSTLSRNIKVLTKQGLVTCAPGEDRRSREISITRKGQDVLAEAAPIWRENHENLRKGFSEGDWNDLFRIMNLLSSAAG